MKALNLKSMSWIMALAMMFIVSFTGCSDDDGENAPGEKLNFLHYRKPLVMQMEL